MIGRMFLNLDNWTQNTRVKAGRQAKRLFQFFCQEKMVTWTKVVSMEAEGSGWICKFSDLKFLLILNRMFLITFTSDRCYKGKMRHHIHAPSRGPTHANALFLFLCWNIDKTEVFQRRHSINIYCSIIFPMAPNIQPLNLELEGKFWF